MNYLETLRQSKEKEQVAYQAFMLKAKDAETQFFCFFEGKDSPYYASRISFYYPKNIPINCGGRENVLKVHALIKNHREYDKYKKAYFMDKDFNPTLPAQDPPIFETPCYSIENFYTSCEVFEAILLHFFGFSAQDVDFQACLQLYKDRQKEFHEATLLFNAWYACLIDLRNSAGKKTGVSLAEKLPKDFITISLDSVTQQYDLALIKRTFPDATPINATDLEAKIQIFQACNAQQTFRGKFEMQFLLEMIFLLIDDANTKNKQIFVKNKINATFGQGARMNNEQGLLAFSGQAETPQSLKDYLQLFI